MRQKKELINKEKVLFVMECAVVWMLFTHGVHNTM